ncbi:MAG: hypothetical protein KJ070_23930 [Verrucomicrobia bacterium]|nr:hypothetical protein [Verrucomicrobiota bacterium]
MLPEFIQKRLGGVERLPWLLLLIKAVYLVLLWGALLAWSPAGPTAEFRAKDGSHYLHLSEAGYSAGDVSCAFYPLWPLLIRWFSIFTCGSHLLSGLLLANSLSLVAVLMFFRMIRSRLGDATAWWSLVFLLLFPGAIFFQLVYTEGLFLLLAMMLCRGLERRRYALGIVAAFLLPLTKAVGVFCIFPILWHLCIESPSMRQWLVSLARGNALTRKFISHSGQAQQAGDLPRADATRATEGLGILLLLAPLLGWSTYFLLMWNWTGNPFEGFEAQKHWGVQSVGNLFNLPKFVIGFFSPTVWHAFKDSAFDRLAFILLIWFLPVIWRLDKGWFLWAVVLGVVPAVSGTFTSYARFESVVFPLFVALGVFLGRHEWRLLRWAVLFLFTAGHVFLVRRFVTHGWLG